MKKSLTRKRLSIILTLTTVFTLSFGSAVQSITAPAGKGYEVAARSDRSDRGFGDSTVELKMVLRNKAGRESVRTLRVDTMEVADEALGDRSILVFHSPSDIDGTALLSHAKILDPDDQWLYLPALKRIKRISSVNKSGPFVGSEFAFEDFTALELNKYDYKWLQEEPCGDLRCDAIERHPLYEYSGYYRQIVWIDQTHYQVRKVEFYDRRGGLLKTLVLEDYRNYSGVWRPHVMHMLNHQTGKSTNLAYGPYQFHVGLNQNNFVRSALKRLR